MTANKIMLDDVGVTPFLKKVTFFSSGGPFLDGYVLAIIGVALVQLGPALAMSTQWSALVGAAALVGLFVGASVGGYLTDLIGRKIMFTLDIIAIAAISIATCFVTTPLMLVIMRFLVGIVIGADYPIATSLVAEFTPRRYRAVSMGVLAAMWYVGATAAGIIGYLFANTVGGWKWMIGSTVIFCAIILLGRMDIPESPRWLIRKGREEEASAIVHKLFGMDVELEYEVASKTRYRDLLKKEYLGKVLFVAAILVCQVVPMFAIYTFGPQIMAEFGLDVGREAILGDILISAFFLIGCIPCMFLLNSVGRRPILIVCFLFMTLALAVLGIVPTAGIVVVILVFGVYALFSGGPGIMQWLYPNELFPTEIRASAVGAAIALSRIGTVLSTYAMPLFLVAYGIGPTMFVGAAISLVGLTVSVLFAPETKDRPLAETSTLGLSRFGRGKSRKSN
jgi:putative MFS transporter